MKNARFIIILAILLAGFFARPVRASVIEPDSQAAAGVSSQITGALDTFDFNPLSEAAGQDFKSLVTSAVNGQLDLSFTGLLKAVLNMLFHELSQNWAFIRNLAIIAILSAVLSNLAESFQNKSAGELGFYACYMALVTLLFASFQVTMGILTGMANTVSSIMGASMPVLGGVMVAAGNVAGAAGFTPLFAAAVEAVAIFTGQFMVPLLTSASAIAIINYLTENQILSRLAALLQKIGDWTLKIVGVVFLGLLSIQKLSAPIINNAVLKTARSAAGAAPVVGGLLGGAMDTVLTWGQAVKSGVMVALIIVIILAVALPLLKIFAMLLIYKVTAAVIQPACDPRIVKCVDTMGSFTAMILGAGAVIAAMFIVGVVVLLSF